MTVASRRWADQALAGEQALLRPDVRRDRDHVEALLHPDCVEVGASGARYGRSELVDLVTATPGASVAAGNWAAHVLAPGIVLVTYTTWRDGAIVHRSSIWVEHAGALRLRHHQATLAPSRDE